MEISCTHAHTQPSSTRASLQTCSTNRISCFQRWLKCKSSTVHLCVMKLSYWIQVLHFPETARVKQNSLPWVLCKFCVSSACNLRDSIGDLLLLQAWIQVSGSTRTTYLQKHWHIHRGNSRRKRTAELKEFRLDMFWHLEGTGMEMNHFIESPLIFHTDIPSIECLNKTTGWPLKSVLLPDGKSICTFKL